MGEPIAEYGNMAGFCGHDGTNWEKVLIDATKRLVVAVAATTLPTGAATEATLASCLTALQMIDNLSGALDSVGEDALHAIVGESVLPDGAATSANQASVITALGNLLTELQAKADLTETQPVSAASLPLPTGAATSANQSTMITALQLIDDLRNALGSVDTDDLQVDVKTAPTVTVVPASGERLVGFSDIITEQLSDTDLGAGTNNVYGTEVASGKVQQIYHVTLMYSGTAPDIMEAILEGMAGNIRLVYEDSVTPDKYYIWTGIAFMEAGDKMRLKVTGATAGDSAFLSYCSLLMDAP